MKGTTFTKMAKKTKGAAEAAVETTSAEQIETDALRDTVFAGPFTSADTDTMPDEDDDTDEAHPGAQAGPFTPEQEAAMKDVVREEIAKETPIQITKREYRRLPVNLKPEEISERGRRHGTMQQEYIRIEEEKKEALKDFTNQLKSLRAEIDAISEITATGVEFQSVECDAVYDRRAGKVIIYRRDTGVEVDRRNMGPAEMQLTTEDYGLEHGIDTAAQDLANLPDDAEPESSLSPSERRALRITELRERLINETITDEESEELSALEEWPDEDEPEATQEAPEIAQDAPEVDVSPENPLLRQDAPDAPLYAAGGDDSGAVYDAKLARLKELRNKESDAAFDGKPFSAEERSELDNLEMWHIRHMNTSAVAGTKE